jgi:hypothetical protein
MDTYRACFDAQGLGEFHDIDSITMFADYRVPQALVHFGVLSYAPELQTHLATDGHLVSGDEREVEIRGCSIHVVEQLLDILRTKHTNTNAILVDFYMWDYAKTNSEELDHVPIHLTRSVFY